MAGTITVEKIIAFLKVHLTFACCWPLSITATNSKKLFYMIFRLLCCLNGIVLAISLSYTLWLRSNDMTLVLILGCELSGITQIPFQITAFAFQNDRLDGLVREMEDYVQRAKQEERAIFQRYINRCVLFYEVILSTATVALTTVIIGPFLLPQPFPIEVEYPFSVKKQPVKTIIYLHLSMGLYQCYVQTSAHMFVALLLWFTAARFEILACQFRKVKTISEYIICIQLHQQLIRYAKDVTLSIRYVALMSIGFRTISIIFSGLTFLSHQPSAVKAQFCIIGVSSLIEVLVYAWPADYLLNMSSDIGYAAYNSSWYKNEVALQKDVLYTMFRCQRPIILHIPCMVPELSLNYYASYLSTAFSYLTTFRAVLATEDE